MADDRFPDLNRLLASVARYTAARNALAPSDPSDLGEEDGQFPGPPADHTQPDLAPPHGSPMVAPVAPYGLRGRGLMTREPLNETVLNWRERLAQPGHRPGWEDVDPGMMLPFKTDAGRPMPEVPQENLYQGHDPGDWVEALLLLERQRRGYG